MGHFMGPFENSWGFNSIFMVAEFGSDITVFAVFIMVSPVEEVKVFDLLNII